MARRHGNQDGLYRAGKPMRKWLLRKLPLQLRDQLPNGEIFYSLKKLRVLAERWRIHYKTVRPHFSLGIARLRLRRGHLQSLGR